MSKPDPIRLGTGAGFSADRLDPAVELVAKGRLDVDRVRVHRRAYARLRPSRSHGRSRGRLQSAARAAPARRPAALRAPRHPADHQHGGRQPAGAAVRAAALARELGLRRLRIAALEGDDVSALIGAGHGPAGVRHDGRRGRPAAGRRERLSRRRCHPAGARGGRGRRDHRPGRRPEPVPRTAPARLRLGRGRLAKRSAPARWSAI